MSSPTPAEMSLNHNILLVDDSKGAFDLYEADWVYLSDYLNHFRLNLLFCLSSSSHGSSWSVSHRMAKISWDRILHKVDLDVQRVVIGMIQDGMNTFAHIVWI